MDGISFKEISEVKAELLCTIPEKRGTRLKPVYHLDGVSRI